ncbi:coiled-coil domain-containing protein 85B-like [Watersipora subatra]|uniref:coiled-coil domain-containing protein 85B-like n=1 Tax=Watersipora subatra TaxID=2589382 RepID=UPI00355C0A4F
MNEEEMWKCSREQLIQYSQKLQSDKQTLLHDHNNKMKDANQRLQTNLLEIRNLKEINKKLQDDVQELRDLCCFLDDDRQKYRKLSREWQRFGRHTSSVIRNEVSSQQSKFKSLSTELDSLLKDNEELKELVLYLDTERGSTRRDEGDGSSGNSDDQLASSSPQKPLNSHPALSEETLKYIQHLEERIDLLECQLRKQSEPSTENSWISTANISQAMKVLEVHKRIESAATATKYSRASSPSSRRPGQPHNSFDTHEKSLLRELCNVAWKTLEEDAVTVKPQRPVIPQNSRV